MALALPHFLGIGSIRCGTVWLWKQLQKHPDIWMPNTKELHFFNRNWERKIPQLPQDTERKLRYSSHFAMGKIRNPQSTIGEFTPAYAILPSEKIATVHAWVPNAKLIFLVRDPRDVLVSAYFERTRRTQEGHPEFFGGTMQEFIAEPRGSLQTIITYYNLWHQNQSQLAGFLLVRYEDLRSSTEQELRKILAFIGIADPSEATVADAVELAAFERMQQREQGSVNAIASIRPGDSSDPESFKTRRGKVGGYTDYLSPEEIAQVDAAIAADLDPVFGYHQQTAAPAPE